MDAREKSERMADFEARCRDDGLPFTVQRRTIFQAVLDHADHPTADQVYDVVGTRVPGLSRTTVYRTLEWLVRMGAITRTCHPGSAVRYDANTGMHHHLVCMRCDAVLDIHDARLDALPIPDTSPQGFRITDFRVQLRGLCSPCQSKEEEA